MLACPFGQFELLCETNGPIIRWTFHFPEGSGISITDQGDRLVSANNVNTSEVVHSVVIENSTVLLISRTSLSPLTSLLEINNTIVALNGTRLGCDSQDGTQSTVMTIIDHENGRI